MKRYYNESLAHRIKHATSEWGLNMFWASAVSAVPLGAIIGSVIANTNSQKYGRKQMLMANNFLGVLGCALEILSASESIFEAFLAGRVIIGIYIGVNAVIAPIYLNEVSPITSRGAIGTSFQLSISLGLFGSQALGLKQIFGTENVFYCLFIVNLSICILQFIMLHFCPESPKFLLLFKSDAFGALSSLRKLRGCSDVSEDLTEIDSEGTSNTNNNDSMFQNGRRTLLTFGQVVSKPALRKLLLNAVVLNITAVFCGIGAVLFYCDVIVQEAGVNKDESPVYVCAVFASLVPFTFVAALVIEHVGRRPLMLAGLAGTTTSCILLVTNALNAQLDSQHIKSLLVTALILYILFFSLGPGPVPWVMVPELVPSNARSVVAAAGVCVNLFSMFLVGIGFPTLNSLMGPYVFAIFIAMSLLCAVTLFFTLPETKGKTSDEILLTLESSLSAERDTQIKSFCFFKLSNVDQTLLNSVDPIF